MDVRLLICCKPGNAFQASVLTLDLTRGWIKTYPSKRECAADLCQIGLMTIMDEHEMLQNDFDAKDRIHLFLSSVEGEDEVFDNAGFLETTPKRPN